MVEMKMRKNKIRLYWNTVKRLKPVQIRYQITKRICTDRKRIQRNVNRLKVPETAPLHILIEELDCEESYVRRFCTDALLEHHIKLLHESYKIESDWQIPSASRLWNYNLHYLEFLIPLSVKYVQTAQEKFFFQWKQLIEGWMKQDSKDSFEPYVISMRIPNMLVSMEILQQKTGGTELEKKLLDSIYRQYRYLLQTQELALLANHYFENLKALVISSLFFGELDIYHKYFDLFLKQIDEQILPDGVHFERSLMYHKIILEDILRVYQAADSAGHACDAEKLIPIIRIMAAALDNLEQGFPDRTPLFNDAGNNVCKGSRQLLAAVQHICGYEKKPVRSFKDAGYYKMSVEDVTILFDCGDIGPSYMGGHGHCDCLSFELAVNGRCLFVNSGTGCYQGERRAFFRSTKAHNTVMIDEREQAELWGEHRAARRMTDLRGTAKKDLLAGRFRNYMGDFFKRKMKWIRPSHSLEITDCLTAFEKGNHTARQFFHLAPGLVYKACGPQIYILNGNHVQAILIPPQGSRYRIYRSGQITDYASDFGLYEKKQVLEIRTSFEKCTVMQTRIELNL